jgi:hypothetical protein
MHLDYSSRCSRVALSDDDGDDLFAAAYFKHLANSLRYFAFL